MLLAFLSYLIYAIWTKTLSLVKFSVALCLFFATYYSQGWYWVGLVLFFLLIVVKLLFSLTRENLCPFIIYVAITIVAFYIV